MSSPEIPEVDLDRLIRIGAEDYASTRDDLEKKLGVAVWNIIELERHDTDRPQIPSEDDWYSFMQSREAQVGPNVSADVIFRADLKFLDYEKADWLLYINRAALNLNIFLSDLPHSEDELKRSTLIIKPKRTIGAAEEAEPAVYRNAPHVVTPGAPNPAPLPTPNIETTIHILDKIAAAYGSK